MQLTKEEIRAAVYALVIDQNNSAQQYGLDKLVLAIDIFKTLNACVDGEKNYQDGDVNIDAAGKTFLLDRLNRSWTIGDGIHVFTLRAKLEE